LVQIIYKVKKHFSFSQKETCAKEGFDIDKEKTRNLGNNNNKQDIEFTTDSSKLKHADFVIIAVPTPVTKSNLMRQTYPMSNQPQKQPART
jgi:UDP-N-acetyl-D-mannosaminuronate dehydrogenase